MKIFATLILLAILLNCWPVIATPQPVNETKTPCPQYIWVDCSEEKRQTNGAVGQYYYIRHAGDAPRDCVNISDYTALYRFYERSAPKKYRYRYDRLAPANGCYEAPVQCRNGELYFEISSPNNVMVEVFVIGTCGRRHFLAQVLHPLFGKASTENAPLERPLADLPEDLPRMRLGQSPFVTYMQTGQTYHFDYDPKGAGAGRVTVLEQQEPLATFVMSETGTFAYTPPHDPKLDRAGPRQYKQTVVLVEETAAGREYATTQTLLLHRSYVAHRRLTPGLLLFGTILATLSIIVVFKGKNRWL